MRPDLSRLTRELRKETCPPGVLDAVGRRIQDRPPERRRFALALAVACAVLASCAAVWQWHEANSARQQAALERAAMERVQVTNEAREALGLIGTVMADAGAHSEKVISDRAVPPLRDSLQLAENKLIPHIEL